MKAKIGIILFIGLFLISCRPFSNKNLISEPDVASNQAIGIKDFVPNVQMGEELRPLIAEKIDTSQKGIKILSIKKWKK